MAAVYAGDNSQIVLWTNITHWPAFFWSQISSITKMVKRQHTGVQHAVMLGKVLVNWAKTWKVVNCQTFIGWWHFKLKPIHQTEGSEIIVLLANI